MSRRHAGALFVQSDSSLSGLADRIITQALALRIPTIGTYDAVFARAGALFAYSYDPREAIQGVARLLKKNSRRCCSRRASFRATNQIQPVHQPQDRESARHRDSVDAAGDRRRGDRMKPKQPHGPPMTLANMPQPAGRSF
jgi:hypothetical protein